MSQTQGDLRANSADKEPVAHARRTHCQRGEACFKQGAEASSKRTVPRRGMRRASTRGTAHPGK